MDVQALREQFPTLRADEPLTYLDNACVTLRPDSVINAILDYYTKQPACAGRSPHRWGTAVTQMVSRTRRKVGRFIGAQPSGVVFMRNTTEAINQVASGIDWRDGDIVLTSDREHNSNLVPWLQLERRGVIEHRPVPSLPDNSFDIEAFTDACADAGERLRLVSLPQVGNLDGVEIPIEEVAAITHDHGARLLVDAAQSVPHMPVDVKKLGCDWLAFSMHKMLGPSGMGILWGSDDALDELEPRTAGGDTVVDASFSEFEFRAGPERFEGGIGNYAGIAGTEAAIDLLSGLDMGEVQLHEQRLNRIIGDGIGGIEGIEVIGPQDAAARGGVTDVLVDGCDVHDLAILLDEAGGILVRSGFHCVNSWFNARGLDTGSLRSSLYLYNTEAECRHFVDTFTEIVNAIR